ncbi:helix-turn-helix domain-containing protein [Nonomuraea gerenzanensis]|uniref:helix-turn-helix domain-containing protein n=1 Tax=Nonomuraea gerenzanensis TaxID=93944 RepID=UPI001CD9E422|nr:AraC family transcriptional regulator [Nonomuraea gerenzanensis]UBU13967.1 AraC family transcriptional regulator [Nonomuraea gerenzanensis]
MARVEEVGRYFVVRDGYALYQGPVTEGAVHRHAAFQVVIGVRGDVTVEDASGMPYRGGALVVAPMVGHRLLANEAVRTFFVEPHSAFADRLRVRCGDGIRSAPEMTGLLEEDVRVGGASGELDGRLLLAMRRMTEEGMSMVDLAAEVGLSSPRLRALARRQLGMPLTRWRIWQRLARSAEVLREGGALSGAAFAGGFADQAHFSREMRRMMGLTPSEVVRAVRG